jgi:hypothetical protein
MITFAEYLSEKFVDAEEITNSNLNKKVYCEFFLNPDKSELQSIAQTSTGGSSGMPVGYCRGLLSTEGNTVVWRGDVFHEKAINNFLNKHTVFKKHFKFPKSSNYMGTGRNYLCFEVWGNSVDKIEITPSEIDGGGFDIFFGKHLKDPDAQDEILKIVKKKMIWVNEVGL